MKRRGWLNFALWIRFVLTVFMVSVFQIMLDRLLFGRNRFEIGIRIFIIDPIKIMWHRWITGLNTGERILCILSRLTVAMLAVMTDCILPTIKMRQIGVMKLVGFPIKIVWEGCLMRNRLTP